MLTIHCHRCSRPHVVGTRSIVSMHQTSEGPIAYVRCPEGHLTIETFGRSAGDVTPTPEPTTEIPAATPVAA